ncbi:hypothetical protein ACWEV9_19410 [Streptomyces albogriseolus]
MSSLQDHVAQNRAQGDTHTEAETALLNAITKAVGDVQDSRDGLPYDIARLKELAEAYALVVHGKA